MIDQLPVPAAESNPDPEPAPRARSRRALLAGVLGGLGAWAASAAARLSPAQAAAGSSLIIGNSTNNAGTSNTVLTTSSSVVAFELIQNGPGTALMGYVTPGSGTTRGVYGRTDSPNGDGVQARNAGATGTGVAIRAFGGNNRGLVATSDAYFGVYGQSTSSIGVYGYSSSDTGVYGGSGSGYAGQFGGPVFVQGLLTKGGGGFRIDHPQDPANQYLTHSFVESPDMKNVYDGVVSLDASGEATVALPAYFATLNRDLRYQLTPIGAFAPLYVKSKLADDTFVVAGGSVGLEVCWQVTGIRQDPFAEAHRIVVEEPKSTADTGKYLHPELYGQPESKAVHPRPETPTPGAPAA